jgi:hypothetical protein
MKFNALTGKIRKSVFLAQRGNTRAYGFLVARKGEIKNRVKRPALRIVLAVLQAVVSYNVNGIFAHLIENPLALTRANHEKLVFFCKLIKQSAVFLTERRFVLSQRAVKIKSNQFYHNKPHSAARGGKKVIRKQQKASSKL